jgi:hypothetical protein
MVLVKPVSTLMAASTIHNQFEGSTMVDTTLYRSTVGSLQYLSLTRSDIAFTVNKVSQFMQEPCDTHWSAVKRILRYLKSTITHTFCIHRNSSKQLTAFSDSDWATCPVIEDHLPTVVFYLVKIFYHGAPRNNTISRSSTEFEYKAIENASVQLVWIQTLLGELGIISPRPLVLRCDNIGTTYLTANPLYHARTKHIEINYHFV